MSGEHRTRRTELICSIRGEPTAVAQGGDLRETVRRERRAVGTTTDFAREAAGESWNRARKAIRGPGDGFDDQAFTESGRDS